MSDVVGFRRSPEWTTYACHAAAAFLRALIESGALPRRPDAEIREKREQDTKKQPQSSFSVSLRPFPPEPQFVQPYPLQENFTGRVAERQLLTDWFTRSSQPLHVFEAIGGMGKSALTWAWVQRDLLGRGLPGEATHQPESEGCEIPEASRPEGVFWWSFYEPKAHFAAFLEEALIYASDASYNNLAPERMKVYHDFYRDADVLIFDAFFALIESFEKSDWGHSSSFIGVDIALHAGVKRLVLYHHDPLSDDSRLQSLLESTLNYLNHLAPDTSCEVLIAHEGMELTV